MSDRNQERNARATLAKQAYLRQHIPAGDYEDFGEFCEEVVGNTTIEGWSLEFVIELVDQFKKKLAERKELQKQQVKEQKSFYVYQTGKANEMKQLAEQIKQEASKKPQTNPPPPSKANEPSALDVLDSIFKNQKQNEFTSNKYDKTIFQSRKFWEMPAAQEKQKENEKQSPVFTKNNNQVKPVSLESNATPLEPEKFDKIFQTGLQIPEIKKQEKASSPKIKSGQEFNKSSVQQSGKSPKTSDTVITKDKGNGNSARKNDIKLLSVKHLNTSKIPYDGEVLFPQPFKQFINCFKTFERHALSIKNLKVNITNHQIINRSFFSSDYVMYHVHVSPTNVICKRNLQDFQKLRRNLESVYPGTRLPYLEKIGLFGSETNPEIIEKQKKYLTFFLEDILSHNEIKNFRILEDFLTLKDHKQMKRKFQEYDKLSKIKAIEQLCLIEGIIKVQISQPVRQYNEHLETFTGKMKNFWGNQEKTFSQINSMHERIAECYTELAQSIENISKQIKDFNRRVNLNEIESLDIALQNLMRYTSENIKIHQQQSELLRNELLSRIRYERENMSTLDAVASTKSDLTRSYLKRKDNEKVNESIDYLSERLKQFKTGITEQSKNLTVLKYQCGYINNLMMNEGHDYFTLLGSKIEKIISNVSYAKIQSSPKTMGVYSDLICS